MSQETMRGVYPILITPYDDQMRIDEESLRKLVEFCIENGVHGIGVALGSEVVSLSEAERAMMTRVIVDQANGRVPIVINTGGTCTEQAVLYSQMAKDNGADALMMRPTEFMPCDADGTVSYFKAVSDAVQLPIFIQATPQTPVPGALARRIAQEAEYVRYIKVESSPPAYQVLKAVQEAGDVMTVFGGAGGNSFIEEMSRGSQGTMPFCSQPEAFRAVWDAFQAGDVAKAEKEFYRWILPFNRVASLAPAAYYYVNKELLRRRGVIATTHVRGPLMPADEYTIRETDELIERLYGC